MSLKLLFLGLSGKKRLKYFKFQQIFLDVNMEDMV